MGVFFTIPLYLQLVLGLDALQTGVKMLPTSVAMFVAAAVGSRLATRYSVRGVTRAGLATTALACLALLATIQPDLGELGFAVAMGILGVGMGLIASQLGLVVQSSVDASGRGEAGGLQYTGQQLGSSLGVALIGALVLSGLAGDASCPRSRRTRASAPRSRPRSSTAVRVGGDFVASAAVESAATAAGIDAATTAAIVDDYEQAQLRALKAGLLAAALIALASLAFTRDLPHETPVPEGAPPEAWQPDAARRRTTVTGRVSRRPAPRPWPILSWVPGYQRGWLPLDVVAGLTVCAILVPEGMAYAELAGMPPETAFYAAPIALLAYAVLGSSRQLVVAVSSAIAIMSAATITGLAPAGSVEYAALTAALAILAGLVSMAAGALKLGRIAQFFSESVLIGFVFGLALLITIKQIPKLLGIEAPGTARSSSSAT